MKNIFLTALSFVFFVGCTKNQNKDFSQELVKPLPGDQVVLEYNGGKITAKDIEEKMTPHFARVREQLLNAYIHAAEEAFLDRQSEKFKAEEGKVSAAELENYMKANKVPSAEAEKVKTFLLSEKVRIQRQLNKMQIFKEMDVTNKLGAARYDLEATAKMPSQGPSSAPVTIQVFCDFGNPICNRSRLVMGEIKNEFGDKVRWIFRHFPVASNQVGEEASLVALCAQQQGQFWQVHDSFFNSQAQLQKDDLRKLAEAAGANGDKLASCLQSQEVREMLNNELKDAQALGLTQTPAYFVNGTKINELDQLKPFITSQVGKK